MNRETCSEYWKHSRAQRSVDVDEMEENERSGENETGDVSTGKTGDRQRREEVDPLGIPSSKLFMEEWDVHLVDLVKSARVATTRKAFKSPGYD